MGEQLDIAEQSTAEREERFRYTDLSHPLMSLLFDLQLTSQKDVIEGSA